MSNWSLIPVINRTNEANIIPTQDLRPHTPVVSNHQGFISGIITNNCNSMIMIFTCIPDIHNNWITLINLIANCLIIKTYTLKVSYTCFNARYKTQLSSNLVINATNEPRISASLTSITILAGGVFNKSINLSYRLGVCEIEVDHRSQRSQSAIIILSIIILVKTAEILQLISYHAATLLYDLLFWLKMSVLPRYSSSQATRVTVTLHPQYILGFATAPDESNAVVRGL